MYCPPSPSPFNSRFLVSAPRCYCLLTRVPFFELHFEMLYSLIAQEHLNQITQFVNELNLTRAISIRTSFQVPPNFSALTWCSYMYYLMEMIYLVLYPKH
ncbi:hypothetical protein S83_055149 [Arachis hypogaea]